MKTILMEVTLSRTTTQMTKVRVPVTVSEPYNQEAAERLAHMKAADAVRGKIKIADPIAWLPPDEVCLLQLKDVRIIKDVGPPQAVYSLLCSNLLSVVKEGHPEYDWLQFNDKAKAKITSGIRWLDKERDSLTNDVVGRLNHIKEMLYDMDAPDELTRKFE